MPETPNIAESNFDATTCVLAEAVAEFVCLASSHGEPLYVNTAGRRMVGLDQPPPHPVNLRDLYDEASWSEMRNVAEPVINRTGQWIGRSRLRHLPTGDWIDVETQMIRVRPAESSRSTLLMIVHRRLEQPSNLATALAEAQARKRSILESSLDPIITINHQGIISEFNRAAELTFGHPREKVLGTKPSEVLFPPATSADQQDRIDRYLNLGEGSLLGQRVEVTAVRANGETFDAEMAMTISREEGEPVMTFFVRDISRRKKAEQKQARYAAELERSNRELEQFAYVASHDLQEPLRKIRTFGDRLLGLCQDKLEGPAAECVQRMQSAAERMQSLIDGLLSLSRVTTQGQQFEPTDLEKIVQEVVSDLESQIERLGGKVEVGRLPTIQADPLQMRQLLQNLITNGLKFHRNEEPPLVRVEGRLLPDRRHRGAGNAAGSEQCRIVVADNGIGFDEKYRDRIFGVFQRLHPRDVFEGTGIGLALCQKIVDRHGGQIIAHSQPGRGSEFEVLLPILHSKSQR